MSTGGLETCTQVTAMLHSLRPLVPPLLAQMWVSQESPHLFGDPSPSFWLPASPALHDADLTAPATLGSDWVRLWPR